MRVLRLFWSDVERPWTDGFQLHQAERGGSGRDATANVRRV